MAQKKISELPLTKTLNADDVFPLVQSGVTKQISFSDMKIPMVEEVSTDVKKDIDDVRYDKYSDSITQTGVWNDGENNWQIERRILKKSMLRRVTYSGTNNVYIYIAEQELSSDNSTKGYTYYDGYNKEMDTDSYNENNKVSNHYSESNVPFILKATAIMTDYSIVELKPEKMYFFSKELDWWVFSGANYDDIQYLIIENVWGN